MVSESNVIYTSKKEIPKKETFDLNKKKKKKGNFWILVQQYWIL